MISFFGTSLKGKANMKPVFKTFSVLGFPYYIWQKIFKTGTYFIRKHYYICFASEIVSGEQ